MLFIKFRKQDTLLPVPYFNSTVGSGYQQRRWRKRRTHQDRKYCMRGLYLPLGFFCQVVGNWALFRAYYNSISSPAQTSHRAQNLPIIPDQINLRIPAHGHIFRGHNQTIRQTVNSHHFTSQMIGMKLLSLIGKSIDIRATSNIDQVVMNY